MIRSREFKQYEIDSIIEDLQAFFPDVQFKLCHSDPRFIQCTEILGKQNVDTIPVTLSKTTYIHLYEAQHQLGEIFDSLIK